VNIISEFADCFPLESKLVIGKENIHTLYEFFIHIVNKYPNLKQPFSLAHEGSSLEFSISRFECIFKSMKKPNPQTAAAITILAVDHFCPEISHRITSCLTAAASLTHGQRIQIERSVSPITNSAFYKTPFCKLPGIIEILSGSVSLDSLVDFVVARISFVEDQMDRLEIALKSFNEFDGSAHTDCLLLFSDLEKLFNVCTSWMGIEVLNDFQRAEHFIKTCPLIIQSAWIEFESQPKNRINRLTLPFTQFQSEMQSVWSTGIHKQRLTARFSQPVQQQLSRSDLPNRVQKTPSDQSGPKSIALNPGNLKDIQITCKGCQNSFTFTVSQQEFHKKMEWENTPAWCHNWKNTPTERRKSQAVCHDFTNGACTRGDTCRYNHDADTTPLPPKSVNIIAKPNLEEQSDDHDPIDDSEGFSVIRCSRRSLNWHTYEDADRLEPTAD
jgi:hypothetical protein